ncbi:MAG: aldose epimerase family protein [Eubacteriales bacterium]|nr:aldose epimerase family protein [Eubacteriales bacterium]
MSVTNESFGTLPDGRDVRLLTLRNKHGFTVQVTNFGVNIVSILVKNRQGNFIDVSLGYDNLEQYTDNYPMFGATVGRNVNRISNAQFTLDGHQYHLVKNRGRHNIHSHKEHGFHKVLWDVEISGENAVKFSYTSPDGENGFPGEVRFSIVYTVTEGDGLLISYCGVPDRTTILNVTNHNYFNLSGHDSGTINKTQVRINADMYTPVDADVIPTGEIRPLAGSALDFCNWKEIGETIADHNYVIRNQHSGMRKIAEARERSSGIWMELYSDLPGMQFYTSDSLKDCTGKGHTVYRKRNGFCMEPHYYPDSVNIPAFETPVFDEHHSYQTSTLYQFIIWEK